VLILREKKLKITGWLKVLQRIPINAEHSLCKAASGNGIQVSKVTGHFSGEKKILWHLLSSIFAL